MNGVVHVGAHLGEEVADYCSQARSPIICFEPQHLDQKFPPEVMLIAVALGSDCGYRKMMVPCHLHTDAYLDTQSASLLALLPEKARRIGWTPTEVEIITVPVTRFENWAKAQAFVKGSCSLLVIDVQGMELQVLEGFGEYLRTFRRIVVECSEEPVYSGGAPAWQVVEFLKAHGFVRHTPILLHGNICFLRSEQTMASITFPVSTIFNQSGTFSGDQNTLDIPSQNARKLICGINVASVTGGDGTIDLAVGFLGPDGHWYTLGRIDGATGEQSKTIDGPIPEILNVGIGVHGATSVTVSYWVIGQA